MAQDLTATDFLVIGSGIAGLTFAMEVAEYGSVVLITKKRDTESNTNYAQGGIAAVVSDEDSFDKHIEDTLVAGAGLCNRQAVQAMIKEGPARIEELVQRGVEFSYVWHEGTKHLALGREGGHSRNRIVHKADHTGREVEQQLVRICREQGNIRIEEHHAAIDLSLERRNGRVRCTGAFVGTPDGEISHIASRITMLATGGCGRTYLHTTNPPIATGDGIAMAYRAGARITNLEFMQFHPTALYPPTDQAFLISEAVRGFGGVLRTKDGTAFMKKYHPMEDLAPRDIVARAIDQELKTRGDDFLYLDITGRRPEEIQERFPNIYKHCLQNNVDITREWIPVVPAAHYMCGGVVTDLLGRTSLNGLFAAGEVACSGVHGANRLASNSLLEAVVFSHRASQAAINQLKDTPSPQAQEPTHSGSGRIPEDQWVLVSHDLFQIRKLMWDYVGIVRNTFRLERAKRRIDLIRREVEELCSKSAMTVGVNELRNLALVAGLIVRCALRRKESRGLHYTLDYPALDPSGKARNTIIQNKSAITG